MAKITSFEDAIKDSDACSKRHLLLGNGFSIACFPDIFHYGSIFGAADFSKNPRLEKVFSALGTEDFEVAIRHLEAGAKISPVYDRKGADTSSAMISDAAELKEILLQTIAGNHPDIPSDVSEEQFSACRRFLRNFLSDNGGQVFSLNYDLLLYWTLMHQEEQPAKVSQLVSNDGFGNDEDDPDADYVVWQGETASHSARVHFLHGALHLFDAGNELQKYTWVRTSIRLIEQARAAIADNKFPLFVAEGDSIKKKAKIRHNAYLYQGLKQLTSNALQAKHCFFIHGHSLDANDDHILRRLGKGKFGKIYISIYGNPKSQKNIEAIEKGERLALLRSKAFPLDVSFYDADSAKVWG